MFSFSKVVMFLMTVSNEVRHSGTRSPLGQEPRDRKPRAPLPATRSLAERLEGIVGPKESPPSLLSCLRSVRAREGEGQKWKGARPCTCVILPHPQSIFTVRPPPPPHPSTQPLRNRTLGEATSPCAPHWSWAGPWSHLRAHQHRRRAGSASAVLSKKEKGGRVRPSAGRSPKVISS